MTPGPVFITGALGFIGRRLAERFRELGTEVRGVDLRADPGLDVVAGDVAEPAARERLYHDIERTGLAVDVLVNNAGIGTSGSFHTVPPERELAMVRLNVEAVVALCGRYVPAMIERGQGAVMNVASTAAFQPVPRQVTYAATKAFVLSFTEGLHTEMRGTGVTATTLCPGPVPTEFFDAAEMVDIDQLAPPSLWTSPGQAAEAGVRAMEDGRRVVVPGAINRVGAVGGRVTPRWLLLPLMRRFYPVGR